MYALDLNQKEKQAGREDPQVYYRELSLIQVKVQELDQSVMSQIIKKLVSNEGHIFKDKNSDDLDVITLI